MEKAELMDIIQKSKDGDMEAMEKLLLHAHTSVSYQCRKMLKNEQDAEDMTQEILVTVYQKLDSLNEPAAFNQWLKKITATRCINVLTRTHTELQFAEDEEGNSILNTLEEMDDKKIPDKWLDNKETTRMIEEIVNGLPDVQRLCTLMFYYSEMSVREIAHSLKVSENTIKSRLNYARKAIKEKVLDYEKKGVKLYGISPLPFLFYFLHKREKEEKDPAAARIMVDKILAQSAFSVAGAVNAVTSAVTGTTNTAATETAATAAATAASGGASASAAGASGSLLAAFSAIPLKVVVGVMAATVLIGGIMSDAWGDKPAPEATVPTISLEVQPTEDPIIPVTEATEVTIPAAEESPETAPTADPSPSEPEYDFGPEDEDPPEVTGPASPTEPEEPAEPEEPTEHVHSYSIPFVETSNCTTDGRTGNACICGEKEYSDKIIPSQGHNYLYTQNLLCTEGGTEIYECTVCGDIRSEERTSGAYRHVYEVTVVEPTQSDAGYTAYLCSACGLSYREEYHVHEWEESGRHMPRCTTKGIIYHRCKICDAEKTAYEIAPWGHDWSEWVTVTSPTETEEGLAERICAYCGEPQTRILAKLQENHVHSYSEVITDPATCNKYGTVMKTCECGDSYPEKIPFTDEHDYSNLHTTAATCITNGFTVYTCSRCEDFYRDHIVASTGHTWTTRTVAPTENTYGYTEDICTVCGATNRFGYSILQPDGSVAEHTHLYDISFQIPATCEENGESGMQCICGEKTSVTHTEKLGHDMKVTVPAGCAGNTGLLSCSRCDYSREIESQDHHYIATIVAPTGTEDGYTEYTCTRCGDAYRKPYHVHTSDGGTIHPATCTTSGVEYRICAICNAREDIRYVDPMGHDWGEWTVILAPTETEEGNAERSCARCSETESRVIPRLTEGHVHSYSSEITLEPTCHTYGILTYSCDCGDTYPENIPYSDVHNYIPSEIQNTCVTGGGTLYLCACGEGYWENYTGPAGHDYHSTVVEPTETAQGYTEYTCSRCGDTYRDDFTDYVPADPAAHTHSYAQTQTPATCTDGGYTTYTCDCGDSYTADETEALGHSYTSAVTDPTETEQGYTEHTCSVCGDTYRDSFTDPVLASTDPEDLHSHSYTSTVTSPTCTAGGYTTYLCSCGDQYVADETAAAGHSYTSSVVDPTETEQGYTEYTCSACADSYRDSYTDPIPAE